MCSMASNDLRRKVRDKKIFGALKKDASCTFIRKITTVGEGRRSRGGRRREGSDLFNLQRSLFVLLPHTCMWR